MTGRIGSHLSIEVRGGRFLRVALASCLALGLLLCLAGRAGAATERSIELVSPGTANVPVGFLRASADGSRVFFETTEKLSSADTDTAIDIYERSGGQTTLVSGGSANTTATFRGASADGSRVFFTTLESLSAADTDTAFDVYERSGGQTTLVSGGSANTTANFAGASADGSRVFFTTTEKLTADDTDTSLDIYERSGGSTTLVSTGTANAFVTFNGASADGSRVFFSTIESLSPADTDGLSDIYERSGGQTMLVSGGGNGPFNVTFSAASADGTRVFFVTSEQLSAADTDTTIDIYERSGGQTTLVTTGTATIVTFRGISADGTRVFFSTSESLSAADTDTNSDVYERSGGQTTLVSTGTAALDAVFRGASADGTRVFFDTTESLSAADTDTAKDLYERSGGTTRLVSVGVANTTANFVGASADGTRVFFDTTESLSAADTDTAVDIYERDGETTRLVSGGSAPTTDAFFRGASTDGTRVFFTTTESLSIADTDTATDIYQSTLTQTLTVVKAGAGQGTVTSSPAGISCGSDCTENYASGTSVTLTAAPDSNSSFAGFSGGGCSGTATTCTVTVDQARNVTATFAVTPGALTVLVSELRLSGPGGSGDQYVELYNPAETASVNVGGWSLVGSNGQSVAIPQGTVIAPLGHVLLTGPGYSLNGYGPSDLALPSGSSAIPVNGGVKLVSPQGATVDAAGFTGAPAGFFEGTAITQPGAVSSDQFSFTRRMSAGAPVDTNDNNTDFVQVDAGSNAGNATFGSPLLGAPAPQGLSSPTQHNDILQSSLLDPSVAASASPNLVYTAGSPGTLVFNRTLTNCSGQAQSGVCVNSPVRPATTVTRLRFRISDLTTTGTPGSGNAILVAQNSSDTVYAAGTAKGLSLDVPPSAANLGGVGSSFTATALLGTGLIPGASINVQFKFSVSQTGSYRFAYDAEDDLEPFTGPTVVTPPPAAAIAPATSGAVTATTATATTARPGGRGHHAKKHHRHKHKHKHKHHKHHKRHRR